jgi:hypothetical protein
VARHKSFGSVNPYVDAEPVTFDIYDETFTCYSAVQGRTLLRFGKESQDDPIQAITNFFKVCMPEEEFARFEELLDSEDKIVDAATLGEIAGYLASEYSTRPTERSSSSASGTTKNGRTSARKR